MGVLKRNHQCKKCNTNFIYDDKDITFDNNGYGYSTKLVKCKHCGCINILRYYEDKAMKLNNDSRFYNYKKESFIK